MDLPRPFWFLWIGTLINRFGYFVIPLLTLYLVRQQGFDPTTAGAVVSAFGAGSLVNQPLGGWLTDRVGRRPTLAGEYTFRGRRQFHGMAIVQVSGDKIRRWREYQYESQQDWADFVGDSRF
jgi:MFS family permease